MQRTFLNQVLPWSLTSSLAAQVAISVCALAHTAALLYAVVVAYVSDIAQARRTALGRAGSSDAAAAAGDATGVRTPSG
jgi:hypothetical protein